MLTGSSLFLASEIAIRVGMLVLVTHRRTLSSSMAWLLIIFFQPWPGLILYVLFGQRRLLERRVRLHSALLHEFQALRKRYKDRIKPIMPKLPDEVSTAVMLAKRLGFLDIVGGNDAQFITNTNVTIDLLVKDIESATHHVHLLFYIFENDETGRRVGNAVAHAAARGVECRLLVDAHGSKRMLRTLAPELREAGVRCVPCLPFMLTHAFIKRMDMRNHRKLAVIDGRIAYTGSQNIVNEGYGHKDLAWHDMMVRLTGPIALQLQAVFMEDWYFETREILVTDEIFPELEFTGELAAQTLPSGPNYETENYQRLVLSAMHTARERVIVTSPYFIPDEAILQAMEVAVLRGVQVDVIVPERGDQFLVGAASRAYYDDMLSFGVGLYLYPDGLLHAKTVTIDDAFALIGSSNIDIRSFALNFEINVIFYGKAVADLLRLQQEIYKSRSHRLTAAVWQSRPLIDRIFQNTAKLVSPLL